MAGGSKLRRPLLPLVLLLVLLGAPAALAQPARPAPDRAAASAERNAVEAYRTGVELFESGDKAQALIEFQRAQELAPSPKNIFMMAHCEYHLGDFKQARSHYEEFLSQEPTGIWAETARQRIESIARRRGVIIVQSAPLGVDVTIDRLDGPREQFTGQAPNSFPVPAGLWRVTAKATGYQPQTTDVRVDSVDTKPLFFPLEREPAHLEVRTTPDSATLYVRGNRARNPYVQAVEPGAYEIYAEASSYESRSETFVVLPGERRRIQFPLRYVQRSGRPELLWFWTAAGAVGGASAVLARLSVVDKTDSTAESVTASATVMAGAALVGGVAGGLTSTSLLPDYLPDNRALFRIGASWIGAVEGATAAVAIRPSLASAWLGGMVGLGSGAAIGTLFDAKAPNYGRAAVIQSGAAAGMLAGALAVPALGLGDTERTPLVVLGGLNLGLGAGLALAYLPDQKEYGPTWQRVMLVDLAMGAGTVAGALLKIVGRCLQDTSGVPCSFQAEGGAGDKVAERERRLTARFALLGGSLGLVAGWLLTRSYDRNNVSPIESAPVAQLPVPTLLPVTSLKGGTDLVPGLATQGRF